MQNDSSPLSSVQSAQDDQREKKLQGLIMGGVIAVSMIIGAILDLIFQRALLIIFTTVVGALIALLIVFSRSMSRKARQG